MKIFKLSVLIVLLSQSVLAQHPESTIQETILVFVRHAEKIDDGTKDPHLKKEGKQRAVSLAKLMMDRFEIDAIYSTNYHRTRETAKPLSDSLDIAIQYYGLEDPEGFVEGISETYSGQHVLIVGHSNTTPNLVNIVLGRQQFEQIDESEYGNLFVVKIAGNQPAEAELLTY